MTHVFFPQNKKEEPAHGADVLRWKMAESDWQGRVYMSDENLKVAQQHVQKVCTIEIWCI